MLAPEDPRSARTLEVQGSHITAAHAMVKTGLAGAAAALVHVHYDLPPVPGRLVVFSCMVSTQSLPAAAPIAVWTMLAP